MSCSTHLFFRLFQLLVIFTSRQYFPLSLYNVVYNDEETAIIAAVFCQCFFFPSFCVRITINTQHMRGIAIRRFRVLIFNHAFHMNHKPEANATKQKWYLSFNGLFVKTFMVQVLYKKTERW